MIASASKIAVAPVAVASALLVLLLGLAPSAALAQNAVKFLGRVVIPNYNRVPIGEEGGLEGGAYTARAGDASAGWYNPAGLAKAERSSVSGNATLIEQTRVRFGQGEESAGIRSIPSFVGAVWSNGTLAGGFTIVSPVTFSTTSSSKSEGSFENTSPVITNGKADSVSYTAQNVDGVFDTTSNLTVLAPGVAFGWAMFPAVRVGAGFRYYLTSFELQSATSLRQAVGGANPEPNFRLTSNEVLKGSVISSMLEYGLQIDFSDSIAFGVAVRQPLDEGSGKGLVRQSTMEVFDRDLDGDGATDTRQTVTISIDDNNVKFEYRQPQVISVGLAYVGDTWEIEVDYLRYEAIEAYQIFEGGSTIDIQTENHVDGADAIPGIITTGNSYDAKEVINLALGIKLKTSDMWAWHLGVFSDNSPVGVVNGVRFERIDAVGYTLGATLKRENASTSLGIYQITGRPTDESSSDLSVDTIGINISGSVFF